jgi:hypothetical protein
MSFARTRPTDAASEPVSCTFITFTIESACESAASYDGKLIYPPLTGGSTAIVHPSVITVSAWTSVSLIANAHVCCIKASAGDVFATCPTTSATVEPLSTEIVVSRSPRASAADAKNKILQV